MPFQPQGTKTVGDMKVDTAKLDIILNTILNSIKEHEQGIAKISKLEDYQSLLRKDINYCKLTTSSKEICKAAGISFDTTDYEEEKYYNGDRDGSTSDESKSSDIIGGITARRLQIVTEEVQSSKISIENTTLRELRRNVVSLKAIIIQLQDEFNLELTNSTDITSRLDELRNSMNALERDRGSSANSLALLEIKRTLNEDYKRLLRSIQELDKQYKDDLDCRMNVKTIEMKSQFAALEELFQKRQTHWNTKMSTFAKKSNVQAMMENFDNEFHDNQVRFDVIERNALCNERSILRVRQQAAFVTFRKCHSIWKRRMQQVAWSKWCEFLKYKAEQREKIISRKRKIRQLLIRHWFGRKQKAWKKWLHYIDWDRRIEILKEQAAKLIFNRMERAINAPMYSAFNRLRRFAVTDKIREVHILNTNLPNEPTYDDKKSRLGDQEDILTDLKSNHYDLSELLNTFKDDKDGAIHTLAEEVNNIRVYDIKKVRRDLQKGDEMLQKYFENSITDEVSELESKLKALESKVDDNFQCLSTQLPDMKCHISEMRSSLHGTINRVKIIEQTHRDRIELLCESKEISDEKIAELERNLNQAQIKIQSLEYNNDRSQNLINTLLEKMNDFEKSQREKNKCIVNEMTELREELDTVNSKLQLGNEDRKRLQDSLVKSKNDHIQAKIASESSFNEVHDILDAHGIRKPKLDVIIQDGVLYEQIAKEKNYVVQLNSITTGSTEVDVTSHIASFSHDYAAWIAFQADHEALQLVVAGKNPEDAIYVEDDMESRRKILVER
jgi:hypothetical protein